MKNIFLNEDQLNEKINDLLTRKNKLYGGEPAKKAGINVSIDRFRNSAVISR